MTQQNLSPAWCRVFCVYECPLLAQSRYPIFEKTAAGIELIPVNTLLIMI